VKIEQILAAISEQEPVSPSEELIRLDSQIEALSSAILEEAERSYPGINALFDKLMSRRARVQTELRRLSA